MEKPTRIRFKEHERKHEWLTMLLKAYYQNDLGIHVEKQEFLAKEKMVLACSKGCHNCCMNQAVPITQIELMGISWYVSEVMSDRSVRNSLRDQMRNYKQSRSCPFLFNGECAIYALRPIACREFHVISTPCAPGEDVIISRPGDIWSPSREVARKTAAELLPFYGFSKPMDIERSFEGGYIHQNSRDMHSIDWVEVANAMDCFDST